VVYIANTTTNKVAEKTFEDLDRVVGKKKYSFVDVPTVEVIDLKARVSATERALHAALDLLDEVATKNPTNLKLRSDRLEAWLRAYDEKWSTRFAS